jgi:hypothetical protein
MSCARNYLIEFHATPLVVTAWRLTTQLRFQLQATSDVICGGRVASTGACFSQIFYDFLLPITINRCSILI